MSVLYGETARSDENLTAGELLARSRITPAMVLSPLRVLWLELTKLAIGSIRPDLVIVDGVKDLMTDINDVVR